MPAPLFDAAQYKRMVPDLFRWNAAADLPCSFRIWRGRCMRTLCSNFCTVKHDSMAAEASRRFAGGQRGLQRRRHNRWYWASAAGCHAGGDGSGAAGVAEFASHASRLATAKVRRHSCMVHADPCVKQLRLCWI